MDKREDNYEKYRQLMDENLSIKKTIKLYKKINSDLVESIKELFDKINEYETKDGEENKNENNI